MTGPLTGTAWCELFSGIGGFARAIRALGGDVVVAADRDPFVSALYRQRFPGVPMLEDVANLTTAMLQHLGIPKLHGVCGGFPCQPVSLAGKGLAQDDERWLWPEFLRIIVLARPEVVLIENVPGLRRRGMTVVLADLAAAGYDAEWDGLPAAAFGAPHLRDRLWITAYPAGSRPEPKAEVLSMFGLPIGSSIGMRAGALRDGKILECVPRAPMQASRDGGWSYWSGKLLPTPMAGANRKGARAMQGSIDNGRRSGGGQSSPPGLEQHVELLDGLVPRELEGVDPMTLPEATRAMMPRALMPTPTVQDGSNNGGPSQFERNSLPLNAAVMLPTPKAQRYGSSQNGVNSTRPSAGTPSLDTIAANALWPTPRASGGDSGTGGGEGGSYKRTPSQEAGTHGLYLQVEVCEVEVAEGRERGALNPDWVDWLMGFPTGWTDPNVPNDELQPHTYAVEPGPRIAPKVANRNARLSALGNALVSYCAMEALTWALPLRRDGDVDDRHGDDVHVHDDRRQDEAVAGRE